MIAKRIRAALAGRSFWLKLKNKYDIDNGIYVLLMPEDDRELNEYALKHIDNLVAHRNARGIITLTNQQWIIESAATYSEKIIAVKSLTDKEIDTLISFYELYAFSERLLIVSLTKPHGSKLYNTVGIHGVSKEDLVCLCCFLMRNWTSKEAKDG